MRRITRGARRHKNAELTRALTGMREKREDNETTEINPLLLILGVVVALFLILRLFKGDRKLPSIKSLSQKPELPGE